MSSRRQSTVYTSDAVVPVSADTKKLLPALVEFTDENSTASNPIVGVISNPDQYADPRERKHYRQLFMLDTASAVLYLGVSITAWVIYATVDSISNVGVQLWTEFFSLNTLESSKAFNYNIVAASAICALLAALFCGLSLINGPGNNELTIRMRVNWVRFGGDALIVPLLFVTTYILLGWTDIVTLLLQFVVVHSAVVMGGVAELVNSPVRRIRMGEGGGYEWNNDVVRFEWWPWALSIWLYALSIVPVIIVLALSSNMSNIPTFGIVCFTVLLASLVVGLYLQASYLTWTTVAGMGWLFNSKRSPPANYVSYERSVSSVNLVFRMIVLFLLLFSYNTNTEWVSSHNCFNDVASALQASIGDSPTVNLRGICAASAGLLNYTSAVSRF